MVGFKETLFYDLCIYRILRLRTRFHLRLRVRTQRLFDGIGQIGRAHV